MITVHCHGAAAKLVPEPVCVDALTPAEALAGVCAQVPGLRDLIRQAVWQVRVGETALTIDELTLGAQAQAQVHLQPAAEGAEPLSGAALFYAILAGSLAGALIFSAILAPEIDDYTDRDESATRQSYLFNGAVNTAAQGGVVPVIYGGPIRVGSTLISAGITSDRQ